MYLRPTAASSWPAAQHAASLPAIPTSVISSVLVGVLVAGILAAMRTLWHLMRVPSALSRRVRRRSYLGAVRAESRGPGVRKLDVYAPRLMPAKGAGSAASIQAAWELINQRGSVRVLTLDLEECLQAGAELLDKGIEVKVLPDGRGLGCDGLTFHLFETSEPDDAVAIVNHHRGDADRPVRLNGVAPTEVFRARFRTEWDQARPLESVIAERIRPRSAACHGRHAIRRSVEQAEATGLHLGIRSTEAILPHLAFRDSCSYMFVIGLPGAGKSYIRSKLAKRLSGLHIEYQSLSDYPYAYLDLMRALLKLDQHGMNGFRVHDGGAFAVQSETTLAPALQALHADIRESSPSREVTLIEFARPDLAAALREFEDVRSRCRVIYVTAPAPLRRTRLAHRAVPPEIRVNGQAITLNLSDNHLLPSSAERGLYASDNLCQIKTSPRWRDRIFEINNELNGDAHLNTQITEFINSIINPYRTGRTAPA